MSLARIAKAIYLQTKIIADHTLSTFLLVLLSPLIAVISIVSLTAVVILFLKERLNIAR